MWNKSNFCARKPCLDSILYLLQQHHQIDIIRILNYSDCNEIDQFSIKPF